MVALKIIMNFEELRAFIFIFGLVGFTLLGLIFPRMTFKKGALWRYFNNVIFTLSNSLLLHLLSFLATLSLAQYLLTNQIGLLNQVELPEWLETFTVVVVFDAIICLYIGSIACFMWCLSCGACTGFITPIPSTILPRPYVFIL